MADLIRTLPHGARAASLEQIDEIVRGSTIVRIRHEKAIDPDHGGEALMIELSDNDRLILIAVANPHRLSLDEPTAKLQPLLVTTRRSRLKT